MIIACWPHLSTNLFKLAGQEELVSKILLPAMVSLTSDPEIVSSLSTPFKYIGGIKVNKAVQLPTRSRPPVQIDPPEQPATSYSPPEPTSNAIEPLKGNVMIICNLSLTCPYTCYVQINRSCGTLCQLNMLGPLLPVLYEVLEGHSKPPHHLVHAFLMNKWVKVKY